MLQLAAGLVLGFAAGSGAAGGVPAAPAIKVVRTVHWEQPSMLEEAVVGWLGYVSPDRNILMETLTFGGQRGF